MIRRRYRKSVERSHQNPLLPYLHDFESLNEIRNHADRVIVGFDDCVLRICDTVVGSYISTRQEKYLIGFDSLCQHADGYVGEAVMDLSGKLFRESPKEYITYAAKRGRKADLAQQLIWYLRESNADKASSSHESIEYEQAIECEKI